MSSVIELIEMVLYKFCINIIIIIIVIIIIIFIIYTGAHNNNSYIIIITLGYDMAGNSFWPTCLFICLFFLFQEEFCDHVTKRYHLVYNQENAVSDTEATSLTIKKQIADVVQHLKQTNFFS